MLEMKPNLPSDFAMKLLDKEMELENECSISTLNELVELYRLGIEYYEEIKNNKFWDLQNRLQKIIMRPQVYSLLQEESKKYKPVHSNPITRQRSHTQKLPSSIQAKKSQFEKNKKELGDQLEDTGVMQISNKTKVAVKVVESQEERNQDVILRAVDNLKSQDLGLGERARMRKFKSLNITTDDSGKEGFLAICSPLNVFNGEGSTNSSFCFDFGDSNSASMSFQRSEELESIVEKIMEQSFMEKTEKVTEIKVKFEAQINEFMGRGELYQGVIEQMREQMKEEISKITEQLDSQRKIAIAAAKAEFADIF